MNAVDLVLIVAGVGYLLVKRVIGDRFDAKAFLVLPGVLTLIGLTRLQAVQPATGTTIGFAVLGIWVSVALGLVRGTTVRLSFRDGALWVRYGAASVALWIVNLAAKGALVPFETSTSSASAAAADHTILLAIGLGIAAENAIVLLRVARRRRMTSQHPINRRDPISQQDYA